MLVCTLAMFASSTTYVAITLATSIETVRDLLMEHLGQSLRMKISALHRSIQIDQFALALLSSLIVSNSPAPLAQKTDNQISSMSLAMLSSYGEPGLYGRAIESLRVVSHAFWQARPVRCSLVFTESGRSTVSFQVTNLIMGGTEIKHLLEHADLSANRLGAIVQCISWSTALATNVVATFLIAFKAWYISIFSPRQANLI